MAITIDYSTNPFTIRVPQADLTFVSGNTYEMDVDWFRNQLNDLFDDVENIWAPTSHIHNTEVTVAGATYSRVVIIQPEYQVEFTPDAQWRVRLTGANNNVFDEGILVQNQVQVIANNSAGLVTTDTSGLTAGESAQLVLIGKLLRNKLITDPTTGVATLYDDDGVTVLLSNIMYEDVGATQTYRGQGIERRERLE